MNLQPGDVVLVRMRFHQATGAKVRPAVVLLDAGDEDFVAAPVTSQPRGSEFDFAISEWRAAGLNSASSLRTHKPTVLAKTEIMRSLGSLSRADLAALGNLLCQTFCPDGN